MEWESKEIEENMNLLIELANNCVPIALGSLLNTFEDMKRDYYTSYTERKYDGVSTTKENKRIYMEALCPYNNKEKNFRYVIHFLDINNMYEQKRCKLTDDILIYKIFKVYKNEKKYIFLNNYYSKDDIDKYEMVIRKKLDGDQ